MSNNSILNKGVKCPYCNGTGLLDAEYICENCQQVKEKSEPC